MEVACLKERFVWPVHALLVGGFICLGTFLRIYNFSNVELTNDEYGTWWAVAAGDWEAVARRVMAVGTQSPFYYFVAKLSADLLGPGPVAFRLPSLLCGIATLGLAYPLALRLFQDRHVALLAVAAFAVNEKLIFFSQDARPYALGLLCLMLSFLCYLSLLTTETRASRLGYLLATAGAYYAHYLLGFLVVVQILHLCLTRGWVWLQSQTWRRTFLLLALLCLPGAAQVASLFGRREVLNYLEPAGPMGPVNLALSFLDPWAFFPTVLVVLALGMLRHQKAELHYRGLDLVLVWFLVPIAFFSMVPPLFGISLLQSKYALSALPPALFLIAWLMSIERATSWRGWLPLVVFLGLAFVSYLIPAVQEAGTFARRPGEGWAKAVEYFEARAQQDDLILFRSGFVEADQLTRPDPDPLLVSAITWPLTANLYSSRQYKIICLPHGETPKTAAYLISLIEEATRTRRVWILGSGRLTSGFLNVLLRHKDFQLREAAFFGKTQVFLLEQHAQ